jgi:hypothetical protein
MSKTYGDTPQEAFIQFVSAMSFPLRKASIESCTSSDEVPSLQYGWPRHSKNRHESIHLEHPYILYYILQRSVMSRWICSDADPNHELEIFNKLSRTPPVPPNVLQLLDHFSLQGPNGVHTVLVQNVLGSFMDFVRHQTDLDASTCGFYAATSQSGSLRCIVRG